MAVVVQLLGAGIIFLIFLTLGMFIPGGRLPVIGPFLWLLFFFGSFYLSSRIWVLLTEKKSVISKLAIGVKVVQSTKKDSELPFQDEILKVKENSNEK